MEIRWLFPFGQKGGICGEPCGEKRASGASFFHCQGVSKEGTWALEVLRHIGPRIVPIAEVVEALRPAAVNERLRPIQAIEGRVSGFREPVKVPGRQGTKRASRVPHRLVTNCGELGTRARHSGRQSRVHGRGGSAMESTSGAADLGLLRGRLGEAALNPGRSGGASGPRRRSSREAPPSTAPRVTRESGLPTRERSVRRG